MSENQENPKLPETLETEPELCFSLGAGEHSICISFADGARELPAYVVQGLGGIEKIKEIAQILAQSTYIDFMSAFNQMKQRESLNNIGKRLIAGHFKSRFQ